MGAAQGNLPEYQPIGDAQGNIGVGPVPGANQLSGAMTSGSGGLAAGSLGADAGYGNTGGLGAAYGVSGDAPSPAGAAPSSVAMVGTPTGAGNPAAGPNVSFSPETGRQNDQSPNSQTARNIVNGIADFANGLGQGLMPGGVDADNYFNDAPSRAKAAGQFIGSLLGVIGGGLGTVESGTQTLATSPSVVGAVEGAAQTTLVAGYTAGELRNLGKAYDNVFKATARRGAEGGGPRMFGSRGPQITSKTVWRGPNGMRVDIENPNPGQRPGQIHFQQGNAKYLYDPVARTFAGAPRAVNDLLQTSELQDAIQKGLRFLGE